MLNCIKIYLTVASTIVNTNTYKPPTMPPTNGDQLSNGVPSNKGLTLPIETPFANQVKIS